MKVKTRITLYIVAAGLLSSLVFSGAVFLELADEPVEVMDRQLKETAKDLGPLAATGDHAALEAASRGMRHFWVEIRDPAGTLLFQSELARELPLPWLPNGKKVTIQPEGAEHPFRVRMVPVEAHGQRVLVQTARSLDDLDEEMWELLGGLLLGLAASALVLAGTSWLLAGRLVRPLAAMRDLAQGIHEKNLACRLPVENAANPDEMGELARTINAMLDRLQYSFERQREFLYDTSHELKTPLTTIRLAADELALLDASTLPAGAVANLERLNQQALRMDKLVKDLLNLSALEAMTAIESQVLDAGQLLRELVEDYAFLAESRNIALHLALKANLPAGLFVRADAARLKRACSNLFDNAIRYNEEGGRVEVAAGLAAGSLVVTIGNSGPGLGREEAGRVFDQFYRGEKSRSVELGGSGLGLSMVKRIVELHSGTVDFASEPGWTRVTVRLPVGNMEK